MDVWQVSRCAVLASAPCAARFGAMGSIFTDLAVSVIVTFVVPLAAPRAGIWQQERIAFLACRPRGLSAALARRVFGPGLIAGLGGRTG
jgi:hypothetical protein